MQESLSYSDLLFWSWLSTLEDKQNLDIHLQNHVIHVTCRDARDAERVWRSRHYLPLTRFALLIHIKGHGDKLANKLN